MKTKTILLIAAAALLVSCGGNAPQRQADAASPEKTARSEAPDMHNAENSLDYVGIYKGTLPAADCPGIEVRVTLDAKGGYALHRKYIDRDAEFDEQGRYTVSGNLLTLRPDEGGAVGYFKVEENRLRWLDSEKRVVEGPLAENYVLTKIKE